MQEKEAMEGAAAASRASSSGAAVSSSSSSSPSPALAPAADPSSSSDHHPPRRRLVKASSLSFKREREGSLTVSPLASPTATSPAAASSGGSLRERDKTNRSVAKAVEEHATSSNPVVVTPKHGRHPPNPAPPDARPLGRRPEGARRHEAAAAVKHGEEIRIQQGKRAALIRAQSVGATGSFKSFDSPFGNYLVPVIPTHLATKPVASPSK